MQDGTKNGGTNSPTYGWILAEASCMMAYDTWRLIFKFTCIRTSGRMTRFSKKTNISEQTWTYFRQIFGIKQFFMKIAFSPFFAVFWKILFSDLCLDFADCITYKPITSNNLCIFLLIHLYDYVRASACPKTGIYFWAQASPSLDHSRLSWATLW